jgi:hypothetical protein
MKFSVIIATSQNRTDWLINRSLTSIYNQKGIDSSEWNVFIVDDNEKDSEFSEIKKRIELLRKELRLNETDFPTTVLKNIRTRHMSGTGSWNTGIFEVYSQFSKGFVSILDDDDEYLPNHLYDCVTAINENTVAVFQRLIWQNDDTSSMNIDLTKDQLTAENFFIGNPGVQGSNMFFKTQSLFDIGGFDETLPNTTDRDLLIRFLWKNDLNKIEVIETIGVIHYNHKREKVNNDIARKKQGLDLFYKKYKAHFSEKSYKKSLKRAKVFFNYNPTEQIIICMPLKNAENTLKNAVFSVMQQKNIKREIILLIGNDNSTDNSETILKDIVSQNPNVILLNVNFGNAYLNRNYLNEHARTNYPNCILIGRLDADDKIYNENTISEIERLYDKNNFDVLMCGNKQVKNGIVLEWENKPSKKLLQEDFLSNQLFEMTKGNSKAELPSCNTFIKPTIKIEYPDKESAEDHWFTVLLLMQKEKLKILIDENLLYCFYSLDGFVTNNNRKSNNYIDSRNELYIHFYKNKILSTIQNKWSSYLNNEGLSFHILNILKNKEKLEQYWRLECPLNKRIKKEIKKIVKKKIRLLDIGCGPFPKSGLYYNSFKIERILIDPMAEKYHSLLNEKNVNTYGQKIINCEAEKIKNLFDDKSFEIIFAKNALDHTYNPILSISNLIDLLTVDGSIILEHYIKEGEYTNYQGLHQWDFYSENGNFYISNQDKNIVHNINSLFPIIDIQTYLEKNKIINIIRKL